MIPKTAGKALSEEELRAYSKCSQLWYYGGKYKATELGQVVQTATEYWMAQRTRTSQLNYNLTLTKGVEIGMIKAEIRKKNLAAKADQIQNQAFLWMDYFFRQFRQDEYFPVSGPLPWRVQIGKTAIDLRFSGAFRTKKNQTLHIINFTPLTKRQDQLNDPLTHLKLYALEKLVKYHGQRPQAVLHLLWSPDSKQEKLGYDIILGENLDPKYLKMISAQVQQIEAGFHFPVVPCKSFSCEFKNRCFPGASGKKK